jgi:predicted permease
MFRFLRRLKRHARGRAEERDLRDELSAHVAIDAQERIEAGEEAQEARSAAVRDFGNILRVTEDTRAVWGWTRFEQIARDLRVAFRVTRRNPGFTAIAVLTLALGIGSTTAIVSVVYGVLLKPLPFHEPHRLVALYHLAPGVHPDSKAPQTGASYFTYRERGQVFEDVGMSYWEALNASVVRNGEPEQVESLAITDGFLSVLGVSPELGRLFQKEDDVPGAPDRVVLSYGYWQRAFGGSRDVIGQSVVIGAPEPAPYEVVGVLPASFKFRDTDAQVFLPLKLDRARANLVGFAYRGIARLKPGVTLEEASADITRMIPFIIKQFPLPPGVTQEMWDGVGLAPNVMRLSDDVIGEMSRPLWILLGTVGFVLLMAWANVVNLLLVRAEGRHRELAVRMALGASRSRIAGALLSESLLLGLAGGGLGILFAMGCIAVLRRLAPTALPRVEEIGINGPVLLVTFAISVVTSLVFGLIPVLRSRTLNADVLKEAGRSSTDAPSRHRTRNVLVVAQVALALVLMVVSGLMARTFVALRQIQPGYVRPAEVQTFGIALPESLIPERPQVARTFQEIAERLAAVPGVVSVGLTRDLMMTGSTPSGPVDVEERSTASGLPPSRKLRLIGAGYFETMGNPLVAGRAITWADVHQRARVAVVSENLARAYWDEPASAIGKRIDRRDDGTWSEIIGVVGNERDDGLNQPAPTVVFTPMAPAIRNMTYLVRSGRVGAAGFVRELQQAVWSVNRNVPLARVRTLGDIQARSMSQTAFAMVMLAIAAGAALLLAVVGIYGVVSYIVTGRTHEVGIRMALGAQVGDVRRLFLRHGLALTVVGLVLGVGAAALLTPIMSAMLFGVGPMDPMTYAGVAIVLGAVTLLATYLPARRASRLEPVTALRSSH